MKSAASWAPINSNDPANLRGSLLPPRSSSSELRAAAAAAAWPLPASGGREGREVNGAGKSTFLLMNAILGGGLGDDHNTLRDR